ncbi:GNAT family N-acetyltransferase [Martelella soudanensis]|uniref:GNAT family N-acetyltransferase n=1 Tax=unclassified Martelella TaxID=2629616 RepID=UPI0015DE6CE8|nr:MULTISPECIES: GNAT family N-acetyltransferase [unclassified Martelella]
MNERIVPANDSLLAQIETWLDAEEAEYKKAHEAWEENHYEGRPPVRGFRCNWNIAKRWWQEASQPIWVLIADNEAVGFLVGDQILEVRPDLRRHERRYGRSLADHLARSFYDEGRSLAAIEITPSSAIPFWHRMGFTTVPGRESPNGLFAYKILRRTFELGAGQRVAYSIEFLTPDGRYLDNPEPFSRFVGEGERLSDGAIQLSERAFCFRPQDDQHVDYFVRIELEGRVVHFDKAKREKSARLGLALDKGYIYFIDRILPIAGQS